MTSKLRFPDPPGVLPQDGLYDGINHNTSSIKDHPYEPLNPTEPWNSCRHCGIAESAHEARLGRVYPMPKVYRCPDCVRNETRVCLHKAAAWLEAFNAAEAAKKAKIHSPEVPVGKTVSNSAD